MCLVSIVLPTYNRASFLHSAFKSLKSQIFTDWELIVVDDGSTDNTHDVLDKLCLEYDFPITIIKQNNRGPAEARNQGIKSAKGMYVAFFDSDDRWLKDHLSTAIDVFEKNAYLDWVYFSCRRVEHETGAIVLDSTFYTEGVKNELFKVASKIEDSVYLLENKKAALLQITGGIDSGLQNSVIRRKVFDTLAIPDFRIGEDRLFILLGLKLGLSIAFMDKITVDYIIHTGNSSDTNIHENNYLKRIDAMRGLLASYEYTERNVNLTKEEGKALSRRLADDYFWKLGYSILLPANKKNEAIKAMLSGVKRQPFTFRYWKTLVVTILKSAF